MTKDFTIGKKVLFSFKFLLLNLIITLIIAAIGILIFGKLSNHKDISFDKQIITIFGVLVLSPFLEELIFRLVLNDFSKIRNIIYASLSFFAAIIFSYYKNDGLDFRYLVIFIWIIIIWGCYFINKKVAVLKFKKYETTLIFISSLLFSVSHFENYEIKNGDYSFVITFIILFFSGMMLAKVRMKIGIRWSMFTHFLFNLGPSVILLFEHFNK